MGAANSKQKKDTKKSQNEESEYSEDPETKDMKIENVLDYIATKYITQADFTELQNLHKAEYCDKLVVLTSKVIKQFLSDNNEIDQIPSVAVAEYSSVSMLRVTRSPTSVA